MGTSAASEQHYFLIIVIYDLCIGYRSYITIIKELSGNERSERTT